MKTYAILFLMAAIVAALTVSLPSSSLTSTSTSAIVHSEVVGCTGGACYWIGGTGVFSSTAHWSLTSGGASCTCTPGATDNLVFNDASGGGTATNDVSPFASGGIGTSAFASNIAAGAGTWTMHGSFNDYYNKFQRGTSTVIFGTTLQSAYTSPGGGFYNVIIDTGVAFTFTAVTDIYGTLTINGALTYSGSVDVYLHNAVATSTPLVFGGSGSQIATSNGNILFLGSTAVSIPSRTDYGTLNLEPQANAATMTLAGDITVGTLFFRLDAVSSWSFNTANHAITATAYIRSHDAGGPAETTGNILHFGSSHVTTPSVIWEANSKVSVHLETSNWTDTGAWINYLTTSASWDPGTSIVKFTFPTGTPTATVIFANPSVIAHEFYDLTLVSSYSAGATMTMLNHSVNVANRLTIGPDPTGTTTLNDGGFGVTAGCLVLGTNGAFVGTFTAQHTDSAGCNPLPIACAINGSLPGLSSLLVIVVGVGIVLLAVGAFLLTKRKDGEGMDIRYYVTGITGFVVILLVTAIMTGTLKGC